MHLSTLKFIPAILVVSAAGFAANAQAAGERVITTPAGSACSPLFKTDGKKLEYDEFGAVRNKSADDGFVTLVCSLPVSVGPDGLIVGVEGTTLPNKPIPFCEVSAIDSGVRVGQKLFTMPPQGGRFNTTVVFNALTEGEITRYSRVVSLCRVNAGARLESFSAEEIDF